MFLSLIKSVKFNNKKNKNNNNNNNNCNHIINQIKDLLPYINAIWYSFYQISIATLFLWNQLGVASMAGILLIINIFFIIIFFLKLWNIFTYHIVYFYSVPIKIFKYNYIKLIKNKTFILYKIKL
jgi:hypothetical protein